MRSSEGSAKSDISAESVPEPEPASVILWLVRGAAIGAAVGFLIVLLLFSVAANASALVAAGVIASFATCYGVTAGLLAFVSRLRPGHLRIILQSAIAGFALAPGIVVGHGAAPAPAWFMLFVPGHLRWALMFMGATAAVAWPVFYTIAYNARRAR